MFVKKINLTLVLSFIFVLTSFAQNIKVIDSKGTLQTFNPWRLNGNSATTAANFLGTTDNIALRFRTNNTERMIVSSTGDVGIGTTSPLNKLVIRGLNNPVSALGTDQTNAIFRVEGETNHTLDLGTLAASPYGAYIQSHNKASTSSLPLVLNPAGGNVGIGNINPGNKLEITQGTAGNSGLRFTNLTSASSATTASSKVLGLNSNGDVILTNVPGTQNIVAFSTANPNSGSPTFTPPQPTDQTVIYQSSVDNSLWTYNGGNYVTYTSSSTTPFNLGGTTNDAGSNKTSTIWRSGNIAIGVNTANAPLEVQTASGVANIARFTTAGTGTNWANIGIGNSSNAWVALAAGNGAFQIRNFSTANSLMHIDLANGNVGIGITNPNSKFEVVQSSLSTDTESGAHGLQVSSGKTNTDFTLYMGADKTNGASYLQSVKWSIGTSPLLLNARGGNVGVGVTNPTSRLEVNGASTNATSINTTITTIDFSLSNLAGTSASAGAFILNNLKDGGSYTLAVKGGTSGTSTFTAKNIQGVSLTVHLPTDNGPTTASKHTLYNFIVIGTDVYVSWLTGL